MLVSEVYLERLLTSRVPAAETILGTLVWLALVIGLVRDVGTALWLLSALVFLPLTLRLAERPSSGPTSASLAWLRVLAVPVAIVSSLSLPVAGVFGVVLALPWLGLTLLVGVTGIFRLLSRPSALTPMIAMDTGLIAVGLSGLAFTLDRSGVETFASVELHAGVFVVPVVAAEATRWLRTSWWVPLVPAIGIPVAASAISFGGTATLVGSLGVVLACAVVATLLVRVGAQVSGITRAALTVAGPCLVAGSLALALGETGVDDLSVAGSQLDWIPSAAGPVGAFGFALPALLGLLGLPATPSTDQRRTMFHLGPPTREQRSRLVDDLYAQAAAGDVNPLAEEAPAGYRLLRLTRPLDDFENSCEALWTWAGHEAAGIDLTPPHPPILTGQNLLFTIPVGPVTITATARVVALISDEDHYGYVLATLDHHPIVGTELILLDKSSDDATLTISTIWRPNCVGARILGPLAQRILAGVGQRYLDGIAEAEAAAIGARMLDLVSEVSQCQYSVSREAIRAESSLGRTPSSAPEVVTQPLGELERLFAAPFSAESDEPGDEEPATESGDR